LLLLHDGVCSVQAPLHGLERVLQLHLLLVQDRVGRLPSHAPTHYQSQKKHEIA
jgi:hypothetical protein